MITKIKKYAVRVMVILASLFFAVMPVPVHAAASGKNVLFISSYSLSNPSVVKQIAGIQEGVSDDVDLYYEFMDSKTLSSDAYIESYYKYLEYKYTTIPDLSAIIVGNDDALQLVLRYQGGFFKDVPVIYESVDSSTRADLANSLGMAGVSERITITDNLDLAMKLFPDTDTILAITDDTKSGVALNANLKAVQKKYRPAEVRILDTTKKSQEEITNQIQESGENTIILYMSFANDSSGKTYTSEESLNLVLENTDRPVFTLNYMGAGSIGSISADSEAAGKAAGEMITQCLNGTSVSDLEVKTASDTIATFDEDILRKFKISKSSLPSGTIIMNDTSNLVRTIIIIVVLSVSFIILLIFLWRLRKINKHHEEKEVILEKDNELIKAEAEIDELTQIGNRRTLDRELSKTIEGNRSFVLYLIDVDQFKHINDTYGHQGGDDVLHEIGNRLNSLKSRAFVPYRYGGDEFAVMCFNVEEEEEKGNAILHLFNEPVQSSQPIPISASIGSSVFPNEGLTVAGLMKKADLALYHVKENGKNSYCSYQSISGMPDSEEKSE